MSSPGPARVCRVSFPSLPAVWPGRRASGLYLAGAAFALGWWAFFDACITSVRRGRQGVPDARITAVDWLPGVLGVLGLIWLSALDKAILREGGWGEGGEARARLGLFCALALLAADGAGSTAVLVVKYLVPALPPQGGYEWYGVANLGQAAGVLLAASLVWAATGVQDETEYSLRI